MTLLRGEAIPVHGEDIVLRRQVVALAIEVAELPLRVRVAGIRRFDERTAPLGARCLAWLALTFPVRRVRAEPEHRSWDWLGHASLLASNAPFSIVV